MLRRIVVGVAAVSMLALFGGAHVASAQPTHIQGAVSSSDQTGPVHILSDPRVDPLTCRNGHIQIGYTGERFTSRDWFGLYNREGPVSDDWRIGLDGQNWQWAKNGSHFVTDETEGFFTTAYWTWDYEQSRYEIVSTERHQSINCGV